MKKTEALGLFLLIVLLTLSLGGCGCFIQAHKGETPAPAPLEQKALAAPPEKKQVVVPPAAAAAPSAAPAAAVAVLNPIHFDFDRYTIRPGDADILKKNADWFKTNANTRVRIEGNCDERGTIEYNLALGQKRADAARNYLIGLGMDAKLLDTISYGKERPICKEHNENCWAENRRDAFVPVK